MNIIIKVITKGYARTLSLILEKEDPISYMRVCVASGIGVPEKYICMILHGEILKDDKQLLDYDINYNKDTEIVAIVISKY